MSTIEYLRKAIEGAPANAPQSAEHLRGWKVGPEQVYICASCAGRILARGGQLPKPALSVWDDMPVSGVCALCGKGGQS